MDNGTVAGTFAITGVPTAPTQSAGNNTTRLATTAFVTTAAGALNAAAYPVGSIFTTTTVYADSAAVVAAIGGTTWAAFGAGKVLVGLDSGDSDFDTVNETGGAKTSTTGSHTLTTAEIPSHTHTYSRSEDAATANPGSSAYGIGLQSHSSGATGGGGGHTHGSTPTVQPYIVVYFWKRTA